MSLKIWNFYVDAYPQNQKMFYLQIHEINLKIW
jgi:hypothetical protein